MLLMATMSQVFTNSMSSAFRWIGYRKIGNRPMSRFRSSLLCFSQIFVLVAAGQVFAQSPDKDFGQLDFAPLAFGNAAADNDVDIEIMAQLKPINDQSVELQVTMITPKGYYTYSMDKSFGGATKIKLTELAGLKDDGSDWKADHEPKVVMDDVLGQKVEKFFSKVTWSKTLTGIVNKDIVVTGKLSGQYCGSGEDGIPGECRPVSNRQFTAKLVSVAKEQTADSAAPNAGADLNPSSITLLPKIGYGKSAKSGLMQFDVSLSPAKAAVGEEVTLSVKATITEPWHTFALDQDPEMAGLPTTIDVTDNTGLEPIGDAFQPSEAPEIHTVGEYVQRIHHEEIIWTRKYVVTAPDAVISGTIRFQMCSNGTCLPPTPAKFDLTMTTAGSSGDKPPAVAQTDATSTSEGDADSGAASRQGGGGIAKDGLVAFLLTAIGSGFIALLTPCVFPMIPVTVAFFLKQEEKKAGSSLKLAVVYCLSIIGAFTILGLITAAVFGEASLQTLANNRWLNLGFAALFTFFGVMLLGVIEIQIPYWLLSVTSQRESAGGLIGVVFMAITFTLVSFTCTFAFVGSLLVVAAGGDYLWPIIGMLGFSTAFASPFFVLALFPGMLKKLPRSGGWMNDVKVVIGLVELAAVVKFLSVADIGFSASRTPVYLTYNVFLWTWITLAAIAGIYLLGVFRKPRAKFSFLRYGTAALFLAFAGRLTAGLIGVQLPADPVWNLVAAFSPPNVKETPIRQTDELGYVIAHHDLDFMMEYERAVQVASKDQQPLFVDFTGVNCVNCRQMERTVMTQESVISALKKMVRAQLYTDEVPGITDVEFRDKLRVMNLELQSELIGDVALPSYAVVSADGKKVLAYFSGLDTSGGKNFLEFLNAGLDRWESIRSDDSKTAQRVEKSDAVLTGDFPKAN